MLWDELYINYVSTIIILYSHSHVAMNYMVWYSTLFSFKFNYYKTVVSVLCDDDMANNCLHALLGA